MSIYTELSFSEYFDIFIRNMLCILAKPHQTNRYNHASRFRVYVNGYELDMSKAIKKVYKFELKVYGIKSDGKEKELHCGPKNEYVSQCV